MTAALFLRQVPAYILASALLQRGGFAVVEGLVAGKLQTGLLSEALTHYSFALPNIVTENDNEEFRGGKPRRRFLSAPGGSVQDNFYHSAQTLWFLCQLTGVQLSPTGQHGTYSYYLTSGDHLALHRDIETCDLTVITCLHSRVGQTQGGTLYLYPTRLFEPLSTIRRNLDQGALGINLRPGQSIVFFGGIVPHYLSYVAPGQERIVSVLCYAA
jgi:hypothetical protein